ncbi:Smr domain protein (macronuclear) [Tetrahymena thermophila SB210]|uniref:Smr domain protein n=1 Tax=Tetrahymena thermophila (strain SB210) TaxID=312017 RepID=I7MFI6_TETTS|nr:Smr domain protein [Tetrahymena thermophila SB210]EAR83991.1 Smr domain protein [Tetrahymena thermophila SB210]|eukprot:XP_001031654.1 Smr domain protein [Tetrahymena thermophila SB210]
MSGAEDIVDVYQKKPKQTDSKGNKGQRKLQNQNKNNDSNMNKKDQLEKQEIIQKFYQNGNEQDSPSKCEVQNVEEQKLDFELKIPQIQQIFGEQFTKKQIKNALRDHNMNLDQTIDSLLSKNSNQNSQKSQSNDNSGKKLASKNNLSSDGQLNLYQTDSEDKSLKLSQNSSDKDSAYKIQQNQQKINEVKDLFQNLNDELVQEALEMHNGDVPQTIDYLLDEDNRKSLELCIQDHKQNIGAVGDQLEQIICDIVDEEQEDEFDLMMEIQNKENDIDDLNIEEDLYISNIKKSMSKEEQQDPQIQKILKESLFYAKQYEILSKFNSNQNSSSSHQKKQRDTQIELKKNRSQNYKLDLEYFKEQYIKENSKKAKNQFEINMSDFPSIVKQESGPQGNIIKQLNNQKKLEYNPNKNEWNQTVFQNEGISYFGQQLLEDLSSKFPHVSRDVLIDIFKDLNENSEATEQFLINQFGKSNIKREIIIKKKPIQKQNEEEDEEIDQDEILDQKIQNFQKKYGQKSFKEVREEIQNIYKYNKAYQFAERNCDTKAKFSLNKYFQDSRASLFDLQQYSKALCLREVRSQNPIQKIDLHGFYAEEALDVLKDQILYMIDLARSNQQSRLKISNNYIQLEIVTGRGSHSVGNVSVLKPRVIQFLKLAKYNYRAEEGKIMARIPY